MNVVHHPSWNTFGERDILQREDAFEIVGDELGRSVERERGEVTTAKTRDAEILDN